MALSPRQLRRELRQAGIANSAIDAAWPVWWSDDAAQSMSATAELIYTVARRLGLSPRALFEGSPRFLWRDDTKFKNLGTSTEQERAILASFGVTIGRSALGASLPPEHNVSMPDVDLLRRTILSQSVLVNAAELLNFCWSFGIPVIQLQIFPLAQKRMHAMTVRVKDRFAILLGFKTKYPAVAAYIIAHELGHIMLGHLGDSDNLLDIENPVESADTDDEESSADRLALMLLTGTDNPLVYSDTDVYSATQLANAARKAALLHQIDPGVLALCLGHVTRRWRETYGALKIIPPGEQDVGQQINELAYNQLNWQALSGTSREYLAQVLGRSDGT